MLLDTSGLLAYLFASESAHAAARKLIESNQRKWTHNLVLAEIVALAVARRYPRATVLAFLRDLLDHPLVTVVWVDAALHEQAITLLEARPDKSYSLCDAVSFVIMRSLDLFDALTTDHHFAQEGFRKLLDP